MATNPRAKAELVRGIQNQLFKAFQAKQIQRLEQLCRCSPDTLGDKYFQCVDSINEAYNRKRTALNARLQQIDNHYEQRLSQCDRLADRLQVGECVGRETKLFEESIRREYREFYAS